MTDPRSPEAATAFSRAIDELRGTEFREDLVVREIPSPSGLAPQSLALAGDVRPEAHATDSPFGTGRFILLHDPEEPEPWGGAWRVVCFAQAPLEPEIGVDPLLAEVAWSWLIDALDSRGAERHSESGAATKTLSTGFGALAAQGEGSQIELRASWSPHGPFRPHLEAWAELVCMLAGLPPGSEGVAVLGARRPPRG